MPGRTVSSSAEIRSTPLRTSSSPSQSCTADQWRSSSSCALTCCASSPGATGGGLRSRPPRRGCRRGCAPGRSRPAACAGPRRSGAARSRRPPTSCRRRPCPCRGSSSVPPRRGYARDRAQPQGAGRPERLEPRVEVAVQVLLGDAERAGVRVARERAQDGAGVARALAQADRRALAVDVQARAQAAREVAQDLVVADVRLHAGLVERPRAGVGLAAPRRARRARPSR